MEESAFETVVPDAGARLMHSRRNGLSRYWLMVTLSNTPAADEDESWLVTASPT